MTQQSQIIHFCLPTIMNRYYVMDFKVLVIATYGTSVITLVVHLFTYDVPSGNSSIWFSLNIATPLSE